MSAMPPGVVSIPEDEVRWRFSRSGGPGGQNVNKVETRVELLFRPAASRALTAEQRTLILERLGPQLDSDGDLHVVAAEHRSQRQNRDAALARLQVLLAAALRPRRRRLPTRVPAGVREARLESKRRRSALKRRRQADTFDG